MYTYETPTQWSSPIIVKYNAKCGDKGYVGYPSGADKITECYNESKVESDCVNWGTYFTLSGNGSCYCCTDANTALTDTDYNTDYDIYLGVPGATKTCVPDTCANN